MSASASSPGPAKRLRHLQVGQLGGLGDLPFNLRQLRRAGIIGPQRPSRLVKLLRELRRWGASPAAGIASGAIKRGDEVALIDESGSLSFVELDRRSNALARALAADGVGERDGVAIMCRNHRGFVDATLAVAKLGASALFMNTDFAAPQLAGVVERERPAALIYDEEFEGLLSGAAEVPGASEVRRYVAWRDDRVASADPAIEEMIESTSGEPVEAPEAGARFVILTSGTTGTPKGAQRSQPQTLAPLAALLSKIPLRAAETTVIAAPMFHSWGFAHLSLGLALNSTYAVPRRFDPEGTLRLVAETGATALVVVPVMMQRILELGDDVLRRYEGLRSQLRVVAASGSALPGPLATQWMDRFGDSLYNLYGSTEVSWATIATPDDLRAAPGTAGRAPRGTVVRILDEQGRELPRGQTGRIFVGSEMAFEGYTGGADKERVDGLLSTGDVGHFDSGDRLFVDGRDDEMIVSGGENVFPREVEDLLAGHEQVREVAVIGVDDEEFGQRLKAFVVLEQAGALDEDDVRGFVRENLARYKVPREVEFLDELPRNPTGKVVKRDLEAA